MKNVTIYWLAIGQLLYERVQKPVLPWKELSENRKRFWVKTAQQAQKLLAP